MVTFDLVMILSILPVAGRWRPSAQSAIIAATVLSGVQLSKLAVGMSRRLVAVSRMIGAMPTTLEPFGRPPFSAARLLMICSRVSSCVRERWHLVGSGLGHAVGKHRRRRVKSRGGASKDKQTVLQD